MVIDFSSSTWGQVKEWVEAQLTNARLRNDAPELTAEQTAALRGEIRAWKRILGLPKQEAARASMAIPGE